MDKHGVEVRLGTEATPELVGELAPDGVVVATGALPSKTGFSMVAPLVERLPGAGGDAVVTAWDVLRGAETGRRVVVLDDDGGRMAAGVAEVLLDAGRDVELVSRFNALFPATQLTLDMPIVCGRVLTKGLRTRLHAWARGIDGRTVTVYDLYTGADTRIEDVDTVVLATAALPDEALYLSLKAAGVPALHRAGDCVAPRKLDHAIYEGYVAGRELLDSESRYFDDEELYREAQPTQRRPLQ